MPAPAAGARMMTSLPGKRRTREHVLADLSVNYVERQVLLCGCAVQRIYSDYGYDLMMTTFNAAGEIEGGNVFFQVKATDALPLLADARAISWVLDRRDLRLWLNEAYPVILVIYDGQRDRAYWLHVQDHFADQPTPDLFLAGQTINVRVPVSRRLDRRSVQQMVQRKNAIQQMIQGKGARGVETSL
jgi:hypothetical protein